MNIVEIPFDPPLGHRHVFLGAGHARNESRTCMVVGLCTAMMLLEIIGGSLYGSIALVADGIHMSTHAGAMLLAALAYRYARRHAEDQRFAFGTGKLGDLAAFASAIVLALLSVLVAYEALSRLFAPIHIDYAAALPIAALGLVVNAASAWILSSGHDHGHGHHHGHGHDHGHGHAHEDEARIIETAIGVLRLEVFEEDVPPRFRLYGLPPGQGAMIETIRPGGARQHFTFRAQGAFDESAETIPEPHEFQVVLRVNREDHALAFSEHAHDDATSRDNNMRAAYIHVLADAAVSVLVVLGLLAAKFFGWVFMDPVMGIVGALVIANWAYGLIRAAAAVLLDMTPDREITDRIRSALEQGGDRITDLHVWRVGPGHLSAIICLVTSRPRPVASYKTSLAHIPTLSHLTIEVNAR